jgi:predicted dehydrogenase
MVSISRQVNAAGNNNRIDTLIIGCGSIGKRHAEVLTNLGRNVAFLSKSQSQYLDYMFFNTLECLKTGSINYVVIANETCHHEKTLLDLEALGYNGKILVEKPLFSDFKSSQRLKPNIINSVFVGYNLRFHPLILKIKQESEKYGRIIDISVYCGQYLPDWRPDIEYQQSYSASRSRGGGVLRDLSHELDYCSWIAGNFIEVSSLGGKFSKLEIDSDDIFNIIAMTDRNVLLNVSVNYLSRNPRRHVIINFETQTIVFDLIENSYQIGRDKKQFVTVERNDTYRLMHVDILSNGGFCCSYSEGLNILKTIDGCEAKNILKI